MSLFSRAKELFMNLFRKNVQTEFGVKVITSVQLENAQQVWNDIVSGNPEWIGKDIRTINFAQFICAYTAKKVCMDIDVNITGSARADYLNKCIKEMTGSVLQEKVEDACAIGGIIFKPNGSNNVNNNIDYIMPWNFVITEKTSNGDIRGIIFIHTLTREDKVYTRLEYHHFGTEEVEGEIKETYIIENKAYKSASRGSFGENISLKMVPEWAGLSEKVSLLNVVKPLFGYLKMPLNNVIDRNSPEGVSMFSNCITELRDLDIAWSKKGNEIEDSEHITFIDETSLTMRGRNGERIQKDNTLPRFVKGLKHGVNAENTIDEHIPTILTTQRIEDINSILSMISTKAGFSQGQFILDRKTGRLTATQIESDDNETIETISAIRNALKKTIKNLVYALNVYADLYSDIPVGYVNILDDKTEDEDIFYFKDLLSTFEQDRNRAYQLVLTNIYSKKKYLMEYEGFSEEEAITMMKEAMEESRSTQTMQSLFGDE